ncbi:MAG: phosphatase PAP2 family protein [Chitinophagales bacterium]|nr:phosphatase PAP2 family protein [Chitinophagales bacterium]
MFPEALQHLDERLFTFVNQTLENNFFDAILPPIRGKNFWVPLYLLITGIIIWKYKWKGLVLVILLIANATASDQISSAVVKPAVNRTRPCQDPAFKEHVILRIDRCSPGKSFTSSHATNTFAFATLLTLLFRKRYKWVFPVSFLWAFSISFAQIYVGVHYPFDILAGMLLGITIAVIIFTLAKLFLFERIHLNT